MGQFSTKVKSLKPTLESGSCDVISSAHAWLWKPTLASGSCDFIPSSAHAWLCQQLFSPISRMGAAMITHEIVLAREQTNLWCPTSKCVCQTRRKNTVTSVLAVTSRWLGTGFPFSCLCVVQVGHGSEHVKVCAWVIKHA